MPVWRRLDDASFSLRITDAGLKAIGVGETADGRTHHEGEELVVEPFNRLIKNNELMAYRYEGFWRAMDNVKDKQTLEELVERGEMPWRPAS